MPWFSVSQAVMSARIAESYNVLPKKGNFAKGVKNFACICTSAAKECTLVFPVCVAMIANRSKAVGADESRMKIFS